MIASIILILYFMNLISLEVALACLYTSGVILLIAEFAVVSLGLLSLNALLALYAGFALQTGNTMLMGVEVGWSMVFGIAFVEISLIIIGIWLWRNHKRIGISTGTDAMIGKKAAVVEWAGKSGRISYEGEVWKAVSDRDLDLNAGEAVTIKTIEKLTIVVTV